MIRTICTVSVLALQFYGGCTQRNHNFTQDDSSKTVKLRNELIDLARGKISEVTGTMQPAEGYVLMYGYMKTDSMNQLPISSSLRSKLEEIRPPTDYEIYVLAHFRGDDILEYTRWQNDGKQLPDHWVLDAPHVIRGSPYRITLKPNYEGLEIGN